MTSRGVRTEFGRRLKGFCMVRPPAGYGRQGQLPPAQPPRGTGHAPVLQGGMASGVVEPRVLNPDNCFSSRVDPHCGQAGIRAADTSCSDLAPHDWQIYSNSGMMTGS